jgi:hypothetical protein
VRKVDIHIYVGVSLANDRAARANAAQIPAERAAIRRGGQRGAC